MILVPDINIWTPPSPWQLDFLRKNFWRHFSVGAFPYGTFNVVPPQSGTVTLSGETIADVGAGDRLYRAVLLVQTDGTVDKIENTTQTQIDSTTDWIDPNSDANAYYEVRYTSLTGDALDASSSLSADTWGFIDSDKYFEQRWTAGSGIGGKTSSFTCEIRYNGGSVLGSGSYSLQAERLF